MGKQSISNAVVMKNEPILYQFCDVAPLTLACEKIRDHSSARILSLCALPLLGNPLDDDALIEVLGERYRPIGAQSVTAREDSKVFTFHIKPRFFWDDNSPITAHDYARGIDRLLGDPSHRFRKLLLDVEGYSESVTHSSQLSGMRIHNDGISFTLRNANRLFPLFFTLPVISPSHPSRPDFFPGAYAIDNRANFMLRARFAGDAHSIKNIAIDFRDSIDGAPDPFGIDRFLSGQFHLTWDTYFPYEKRNTPLASHIEVTDPNLLVLLSTFDCEQGRATEALKALATSLDRDAIVHACDDAPSAIFGFSSGCHEVREHLTKRDSFSNSPIEIGYEDFFPNAIIVDKIVHMLRDMGCTARSKKLVYGERSTNCQMRLELIHNPLSDPILLYRNELSKRSFFENHQVLWREFRYLFSQYQISESHKRKSLARELDRVLHQRGDFLPLIKLPGYRLRSDKVGACPFISGKLWEWA